jgi:hypothetical protein
MTTGRYIGLTRSTTMKEEHRIRSLQLSQSPDGVFAINGTIDCVILDDAGAVYATKPGAAGVSLPVGKDHPLFSAVEQVANGAIAKHLADVEETKAKLKAEAEAAAERAKAAAEAAAQAAEKAK